LPLAPNFGGGRVETCFRAAILRHEKGADSMAALSLFAEQTGSFAEQTGSQTGKL
jgi:hypothetical protein